MALSTYAQLQRQIAELQGKADRLREQEKAAAIGQIRETVALYGLTAKDIFGARGVGKTAKSVKTAPAVRFADGNGNTWGGRGPHPRWLSAAIAEGHQLAEFSVDKAPAAPPVRAKAVKARKAPKAVSTKGAARKRKAVAEPASA